MEKRVNLRVEHVKHSKCRQEFLDRVKSNAQKKKEAKEAKGNVLHLYTSEILYLILFSYIVPFNLKRIPAQPREARFISAKFNVPQTIAPVAYETLL
jgi:large subunit ribosomal protein L21e